jgi:hypothetical protein
MNLIVSQILSSAEDGTSPQDIASALNLEPSVVLAVIESRAAQKDGLKKAAKDPTKIPTATVALLQQALIQTALESEDERLRARVAMRLVDDFTGRLDKHKDPLKNITQVNINEINIRFRNLKETRPSNPEDAKETINV